MFSLKQKILIFCLILSALTVFSGIVWRARMDNESIGNTIFTAGLIGLCLSGIIGMQMGLSHIGSKHRT